MNLKTIEDISKFIGGYVSGSNTLVVNLEDGTMLDFRQTVNGIFTVTFSNGKVWSLEFDLDSNIEKRILKLYGHFG